MGLLTVEQLLTLNKIPKSSELTLKIITDFYLQHLSDRQFRMEIASPLKEIRIRFERGNLAHLLGIHHILGNHGGGYNGFIQLNNENITFESLKAANNRTFKDDELRMLCFPFLYQMMQKPQLQLAKSNDPTQASFVFRHPLSQKFCEFRIRKINKDPESRFYSPLSFRVGRSEPFTQVKVRNVETLDLNDSY
ncbi:PBECR4 domain-containing protein [Paenibacillus bovis]|uniref:Phage-Barnase-EndoU-ColicinE5/D-RelE like nuclease 4 domain-containing protein n=1 Tax=Paenibacillus bovis TaxID=1616788 RepID=A0A1X9T441_9BACL|nr:PBECR4 domain-containing protein [Paenibacillus bovis]ARR10691.1 hypothetical protein AR543_p0083 [Paenibacillus bovis]